MEEGYSSNLYVVETRQAAQELAIRALIERAPLASSLAMAFKAEGFTLALVGGPVRNLS